MWAAMGAAVLAMIAPVVVVAVGAGGAPVGLFASRGCLGVGAGCLLVRGCLGLTPKARGGLAATSPRERGAADRGKARGAASRQRSFYRSYI